MRGCTGIARGATLLELLLSLLTLGVLLGIAVPRVGTHLDRLAVRGAAREVRTQLAVARVRAVGSGRGSAVYFRARDTSVVVRVGPDTVLRRPLGQIFGVSLRATRPSTAYGVNGLGISRANLSIVLRRRAAVETVFVSREGRVR